MTRARSSPSRATRAGLGSVSVKRFALASFDMSRAEASCTSPCRWLGFPARAAVLNAYVGSHRVERALIHAATTLVKHYLRLPRGKREPPTDPIRYLLWHRD